MDGPRWPRGGVEELEDARAGPPVRSLSCLGEWGRIVGEGKQFGGRGPASVHRFRCISERQKRKSRSPGGDGGADEGFVPLSAAPATEHSVHEGLKYRRVPSPERYIHPQGQLQVQRPQLVASACPSPCGC